MPTDLLTPAPAPAEAAAPAGAAVPVFLDLNQRRVLLVGGGAEALAQLTTVLADHPTACVTVVAPRLLPELTALTQRHPQVQVLRRAFEPTDLAGHDLVLVATPDAELHGRVRAGAAARRLHAVAAFGPAAYQQHAPLVEVQKHRHGCDRRGGGFGSSGGGREQVGWHKW